MTRGRAVIAAVVALWQALAATATGQTQPAMAPVPKSCEGAGDSAIAGSQMPRVATALKERKKIRILAIGGGSVTLGGRAAGSHYALIEKFLEASFKGLDVEIIDRGVSGELAADAADRIKTEVALNEADLLLWQLGTADALAQVDTDDLRRTVTETLAWLKQHGIDVILIGVRYAPQLVDDPHYQAVRRIINEVATELGVMRLGRYEAEETLARVRRDRGQDLSEVEVSEASYVCMAEYLSRAIAAGLFARQSPPRPAHPTPPKG